MQWLGIRAGVETEKIYPHNLRHLFARSYYDQERDLSRLADILGHSSINTTRIYTCLLYTSHRLYQILKQRFGAASPEAFEGYALHYKVKRAQPASKKQKEDLRYLVKYHKIKLPVQIDSLSRSEASRLKDQIISQYGRICPADASGHRGIV